MLIVAPQLKANGSRVRRLACGERNCRAYRQAMGRRGKGSWPGSRLPPHRTAGPVGRDRRRTLPFWEKELGRISGKSKLDEAIRDARSRPEAHIYHTSGHLVDSFAPGKPEPDLQGAQPWFECRQTSFRSGRPNERSHQSPSPFSSTRAHLPSRLVTSTRVPRGRERTMGNSVLGPERRFKPSLAFVT